MGCISYTHTLIRTDIFFWCTKLRMCYRENMKRDDAQLVADATLGIQGSFDTLVHRYTTPLYHFAFRLTGNAQVAEDMVQETFVKVWKNLEKYDKNQVFRAWIFTIARNTITDYMRKKKTIPFSALSRDEETPFEATISDNELLPDKTLKKIEDAQLLEKLLAHLPPDYQTVLVLHYQENMTFDEIGKVVGKPLNTVKSWHRRALLKLREFAEAL